VKTTVEKLSPTRAKLTITVGPDELKPAIAHAYEHIAEQVQIPGFRKGKVPAPLIDQRVGRMAVLEHAVGEGLEGYYRQAVVDEKVRPMGRPEADVTTWPNEKDFTGDLVVTVEVPVRPEIKLPDVSKLKVEVEPIAITPDEIMDELDRVRSRFGTLVAVDRPAKKGDFVQLDLTASIGGNTVDTAESISYELGSGELIEGIDEALDSLTAGESTTFESVLLGGDHEGETAQIAVSVSAVKERELPKADDEFAQLASEFDTIAEFRESLKGEITRRKGFDVGREARAKLIDALIAATDIPLPDGIVDDEVHRHLEGEGRLEDDAHRAEVIAESTKTFKQQILLDTVAEAEGFEVSQEELSGYIFQGAMQYGMSPEEFMKVLTENNQIGSVVADVARNKALTILVERANVVDTKGTKIDLAELAGTKKADDANAEVGSEADSEVVAKAEKKPAKKAKKSE
jgi:trigger factor